MQYELEQGDFFEAEGLQDRLNQADVIFINNFAFGPKVNEKLKVCFAEWFVVHFYNNNRLQF